MPEAAARLACLGLCTAAGTSSSDRVAAADGETSDSSSSDASTAVRNPGACKDPLLEVGRGTLSTYGRSPCCKSVRRKPHNQGLLLVTFESLNDLFVQRD